VSQQLSIKVIIEGGSNNSDAGARKGFSDFFKNAGLANQPRIIIAGPRNKAIKQYWNQKDQNALLLIDSEGSITRELTAPNDTSWKLDHLIQRGDLTNEQRHEINSDNVFFMVQTMESWIIADIESVVTKAKRSAAIGARTRVGGDVEKLDKQECERIVDGSLPSRQPKGKRMELIGKLDPAKVELCSRECKSLLERLRE
jgi:hypothetical protein